MAVGRNRPRSKVPNYLKNPDNYSCIKRNARTRTVDQRRKEPKRHLATNKNTSYRQINAELGLNVTRQRVQEVFKEGSLRYEHKIARLTARYENARIAFVNKYKCWEEEFGNTIFSVEQNFNSVTILLLLLWWPPTRPERD
uniref:Transposase Tc1-like domain-containing protein n=1 Tax=Glossina austeni TaxID=7395 RepID=A0A1A9VGA2_GLOAU